MNPMNIFPWNKKKKEEETKTKPKMITGWELSMTFKDNTFQSFSHPEYRGLFHVYQWFVGRKSPVYDVEYKDGRTVIVREQIKRMSLNKKQLVDTWSKKEEEA